MGHLWPNLVSDMTHINLDHQGPIRPPHTLLQHGTKEHDNDVDFHSKSEVENCDALHLLHIQKYVSLDFTYLAQLGKIYYYSCGDFIYNRKLY
jgi:hypothetical protein